MKENRYLKKISVFVNGPRIYICILQDTLLASPIKAKSRNH